MCIRAKPTSWIEADEIKLGSNDFSKRGSVCQHVKDAGISWPTYDKSETHRMPFPNGLTWVEQDGTEIVRVVAGVVGRRHDERYGRLVAFDIRI